MAKPHLAMQRGCWMVYACGREHLDRRAVEWVLAQGRPDGSMTSARFEVGSSPARVTPC